MFDLNDAIAQWRRQMTDSGVTHPEVLDELESHLRDEVEEQVRLGQEPQQAFSIAIERIGDGTSLKREFAAAGHSVVERAREIISILAGIPNPCLFTSMNTSYIEPRWATYLKAAGFLAPAIFLATVSAIWVVPKLQQICAQADLPAATAGTFWILTQSSIRSMRFLAEHGLLIMGTILSLLVLLEWRARGWPRYRRLAVGIGAFVLNSIVLFALFMMFLAAILAAPGLK